MKSLRVSKTLRILTSSAILVFLLLVSIHPITANTQNGYKDITCEYAFSGIRHSYNSTIQFQGKQLVTLVSTDPQTIMGYINWNISLDNGQSWETTTETHAFTNNRTYKDGILESYTAWWIAPETQVGNLIPIDGDLPATNYPVRSNPFLVMDLTSLSVGTSRYTCWWLVNENPNGIHESFYYEQWTGMLVAAYSELVEDGVIERLMQIELQSATPALPHEGLFTHLWLTYGAVFLSLTIASVASIGAYLLLQNFRRRRIKQSPQLRL